MPRRLECGPTRVDVDSTSSALLLSNLELSNKAHRLCVSLNSRLESNKEEQKVWNVGFRVEGLTAAASVSRIGALPACGVRVLGFGLNP